MNKEKILALAAAQEEHMVTVRHELHKHPEMGWHEERTTDVIERELRALGLTRIRRGFGGTNCGLICDIGEGRPRVAIRADIDALAVAYEDNDLPYKSEVPGVMHACGHDAHAASLLGAAAVFAQLADELPGSVRLMFQPSEEQATTPGAKAFIAEGALEDVDAVIGYHVRAGAPEGKILYTPGPATTSGDIWELDIVGHGGHGSRPHEAVDPTVCAAQIIGALQTIVSRELPPGKFAVISIGTLKSGSAVNVIPDKCEITGNIRTTDPAVRDTLPERISRIAKGIGEAMRCTTEFRFIPVYPSIINDIAMGKLLETAGDELYGVGSVQQVPISNGSDDFNFYSTVLPSVYFNVGMGEPGTPYAGPHHSPQFRTNDAILKVCAATVVAAALKAMEAKK